jgi:hypothetical protein
VRAGEAHLPVRVLGRRVPDIDAAEHPSPGATTLIACSPIAPSSSIS